MVRSHQTAPTLQKGAQLIVWQKVCQVWLLTGGGGGVGGRRGGGRG